LNIIQIHSKTYRTLFVPDYQFDFICCVLFFHFKDFEIPLFHLKNFPSMSIT